MPIIIIILKRIVKSNTDLSKEVYKLLVNCGNEYIGL